MGNQVPKLEKIIVATDFSESAAAALQQALWIAERTGAEVAVVHVLSDLRGALLAMPSEERQQLLTGDIGRFEHALRADSAARLESLLAPLRGRGVSLRPVTLVGVPFLEIIYAVQKEGCDVLLVGTRGLSRLGRFFIGSTAERLVRKCPCPVWVVKAGSTGSLGSILVPVDFSDVCAKALKLSAILAGLSGARLTVLHVFDVPAEVTLLLDINRDPTGTQIRRHRSKVKRAAGEKLRAFVSQHVSQGVGAELQLARGEPASVITTWGRKVAADLVVMGSVVRTGIPGFVMGNTAEKVLRSCGRSVLTVKPDGFVSPVQPLFSAAGNTA